MSESNTPNFGFVSNATAVLIKEAILQLAGNQDTIAAHTATLAEHETLIKNNRAILKAGDAVQITLESESLDYNDYTAPGTYIAGNADVVAALDHKPSITTPHRLYVLQTTNALRVVQIVVVNTTSQAAQIYKRIGTGTNSDSTVTWSWTGWNRVIDSDNLSDYIDAEKVQIPRNFNENTGAVGDTIDLDLVLKPGFYRFPYDSESQATMLVKPSCNPEPGRTFSGLIVEEYYPDNGEYTVIRQVLFNNTLGRDGSDVPPEKRNIYVRYRKGNGAWTYWEYLLTSIDMDINSFPALKWGDATAVQASEDNHTDYDDYTTPGNYVALSGTVTSYIDNKPPISAAHRLYVLSTTSSNTIVQIVITNATSPAVQIYKRIRSGSTWTDWNRVVDSDNLASLIDTDRFAALRWGDATAVQATSDNHADYNDFTTPGNYVALSTTVTAYIDNKPDIGAAHRLIVLSSTSSSVIMQIVITNATSPAVQIYKRFYNGSTWTAWNRVIDSDNLSSYSTLLAGNATSITDTSGVDYNDYTTPGIYRAGSSSVVQNIDNKPDIGATHRLYVLQTTNSSHVVQIVVTNATSPAVQIYKRLYNGSTWTAWNRIVDTDNIYQIFLGNTDITGYINKNTELSYPLPQSDYKVGIIIYDGANGGQYSNAANYRVSTPNIHVAETDLLIRPKAGYALFLYLYTDGVYQGTYNGENARIESATISAGQQYKISVGKIGRPAGEAAVLSEYCDKVQLLNPLQKKVDELSSTSSGVDFGVIPKGTFYPGIDADDYEDFGVGDPDQHTPMRGKGTDIFNVWPKEIYDKFHALYSAHTEYITEYHYTPAGDLTTAGTWTADGTELTATDDLLTTQYAFVLDPILVTQTGVTFPQNIPTVFIISGEHGYEKSSPLSLYYLFKHMISNTTANPILQYLRHHCRIVCMPFLNHYGCRYKAYTNGPAGDAETPESDWGVNLNRNWGVSDWVQFDITDPRFDNDYEQYTGPDPFSEVETRAARDLFNLYKSNIVLAIDYHTNGHKAPSAYRMMNEILFSPDNTNPAKVKFENAIRYHISNITAQFIPQYELTYAPAQDVWKPQALCGRINLGSSHSVNTAKDWFDEQGVLACTFETFAGFPEDEPSTYDMSEDDPPVKVGHVGGWYVPKLLKASEELLANFIVAVLNYIS